MNKALQKLLLIQVQKGKDPKAFERIYDEMADSIYRFIYFKVSHAEIAQDLTSDVFLKLWENLTQKEAQVQYLRAYIYIIARTTVIDYYRSSKSNKTVDLSESLEIESDDLVEKVDTKIQFEGIMAVIGHLKDSYQEILLLRHVNELSIKEIANVLEKTPAATRVQLHRAQEALKREYEKASR